MQVLELIWTEKPETASRLRGRIEAVLDAATVRGFRQGPSPAQWKGNLAHILPAGAKVRKVKHHAALPLDQMQDFIATLRSRSGMAARALEFAALTAVRTGEVLGARWGEVRCFRSAPFSMRSRKERYRRTALLSAGGEGQRRDQRQSTRRGA